MQETKGQEGRGVVVQDKPWQLGTGRRGGGVDRREFGVQARELMIQAPGLTTQSIFFSKPHSPFPLAPGQ